ncbi:MAG: hypothetical protein Fur0022_06340 [Anaerolineales bacterium]
MLKFRLSFIILFLILSAKPLASSAQNPPASPFSSLPLIKNIGQFDPRVQYLAQGDRHTLWITEDGLWITIQDQQDTLARLTLPNPTSQDTASPSERPPIRVANLHLTFPDQPSLAWDPFARQHTTLSYFTPQGAFTDIPVFGGVRAALSPDLALEISGVEGQVTFKFVSPSASAALALHLEGADALWTENGLPTLATPLGVLSLPFQTTTPLNLRLSTPHTTQTLLLEPFTPAQGKPFTVYLSSLPSTALVYSTLLGGAADDQPNTVAFNAQGEIYVAGETYSLPFPTAPGLEVPTHLVAAFIAKFNSTNTGLDYLVNIVSAGLTENVIKDLVIDSTGNAYAAGYTDSADFPTTPGAYDTVPPAATNLYKAFVMKLNPTGQVVYATLLGTNTNSELGNGIAIDAAGNAYLTGYTESPGFPTTAGAYDQTLGGTRDAFVTKFNAVGSGLMYSTFIGGTSRDNGERIALDAANNVIMSGYSEDGPTYPQTTAPIGITGTWDLVVTKLNANGTGLIYSTIIGGSSYDFFAQGLALDAAGNAYLSGGTYSPDFPTTPGAYDISLNGTADPVVLKLNAAGNALAFSTYLGGSTLGPWEFIYDLALDSHNQPYVVGVTESADFPTTPGAFRRVLAGPMDMFAVQLNPSGSGLVYATLLGGSLEELGYGIAVKAPNEFVVTGSTYSTDFPTTPGALDRLPNGGSDGVIAAFKPLPYSLFLPVTVR